MSAILSHALIVLDIVSIKVFVWMLGQLFVWAVDPNGGILDSHLFFYDRYCRLPPPQRSNGQGRQARSYRGGLLSSRA
jgi:hypothetical protein